MLKAFFRKAENILVVYKVMWRRVQMKKNEPRGEGDLVTFTFCGSDLSIAALKSHPFDSKHVAAVCSVSGWHLPSFRVADTSIN